MSDGSTPTRRSRVGAVGKKLLSIQAPRRDPFEPYCDELIRLRSDRGTAMGRHRLDAKPFRDELIRLRSDLATVIASGKLHKQEAAEAKAFEVVIATAIDAIDSGRADEAAELAHEIGCREHEFAWGRQYAIGQNKSRVARHNLDRANRSRKQETERMLRYYNSLDPDLPEEQKYALVAQRVPNQIPENVGRRIRRIRKK
jgi:hypothetical protein